MAFARHGRSACSLSTPIRLTISRTWSRTGCTPSVHLPVGATRVTHAKTLHARDFYVACCACCHVAAPTRVLCWRCHAGVPPAASSPPTPRALYLLAISTARWPTPADRGRRWRYRSATWATGQIQAAQPNMIPEPSDAGSAAPSWRSSTAAAPAPFLNQRYS